MACAASVSPGSTSRSAVSNNRAMKAMAAIDSGTVAASVPIDVPATSRVNGTIETIRMMNGTDRTALISPANTRLTGRLAAI